MIIQEKGTYNCGQCCLATILNISLEEAIKLVGHNKTTKSKELTRHLKCSRNIRGNPNVDSLCILRYKKATIWHWIINYSDGTIYDPLIGIISKKEYFIRFPNYRITSYFELFYKK